MLVPILSVKSTMKILSEERTDMHKEYKEMIYDFLTKKCFQLKEFDIQEENTSGKEFLLLIHQKTLTAFILCVEMEKYFLGAYTPHYTEPVNEIHIAEDLTIEFPEDDEDEYCDIETVINVHLTDFLRQVRVTELYLRLN